MGIVQVEQNRLRQQQIEVKALIALSKYGANDRQKWKALAALERIAYPEDIELWNVQIVEAVIANANGNTKDRTLVIACAYTKGVGGCYDL